jgi:polyhydroxybutyrate depolymerase
VNRPVALQEHLQQGPSRRCCVIRLVATQLLVGVTVSRAASTIQFTAPSYTVAEDQALIRLQVERTDDTNAVVSVDYASTNLTATPEVDYVDVAGTLRFEAGVTQQSFTLTLMNDGLVELTELFRVNLRNPTGGALLGAHSNATVLITDNDTGIQLEARNYSVTDDATAVSIGVVRGDDGGFPVTVDFVTEDRDALAGQEYAATNGTLSFWTGEKVKFVTIPILNGGLKEFKASFRLHLTNALGVTLGPRDTATVTITERDLGVSFSRGTYPASEDAGEVAVTVLRRGQDPESLPFDVGYATRDLTAVAGVDYGATSGSLHFAAGEQARSFVVPVFNNGLRGAAKTLQVALSQPSGGQALGGPSLATIRIDDNDPGVGFDTNRYSVWRNAGEVRVTVLRGNDRALGPVTVDYSTADFTAKAGYDYQAVSGTMEFKENETVKSLTIPLLRNAATWSVTFFGLMLSHPTGGALLGGSNATVCLYDLRAVAGAMHTLAPAFESNLAITPRHPGLNVLTWNGAGQLQRADTPEGPWQTRSDALSPTTIESTTPLSFFRIKHPRPADVFIPSAYDGEHPLPLVILLHGYSVDGAWAENYMRLAPLAEEKGFLYCFPDGAFDELGYRFWNAGDACCDFLGQGIDDAGYLRGLIEEIGRQFALDRKRVSLIGHSNGGFMAYRMACEHADLIAAVASLAGTTPLEEGVCMPSQPVNVLHIHGTGDSAVPYSGGSLGTAAGFPADEAPFPGARETVERWAEYNGSRDAATEQNLSLDLDLRIPGPDTVITRYTDCPAGGAVELWTMIGGSHMPVLFNHDASSEFSAKIVEWLLAHPKP